MKYKLYHNKLPQLICLSKKSYFHFYFQLNLNNTNRIWKGINTLLNNNKKKCKPISALRDPSTNLISNCTNKLPNI